MQDAQPTTVATELQQAMQSVNTGRDHRCNKDILQENKRLQEDVNDLQRRLHMKDESLSALEKQLHQLKALQGTGGRDAGKDVILRLQKENEQKSQALDDLYIQLSAKEKVLRVLQQKTRGSKDQDAKEQEVFVSYQRHVQDLSKELEQQEKKSKKQLQEINQLQRRLDHAERLEEQVTSYAMDVSRLEEEKRHLQKQLQEVKGHGASVSPAGSPLGQLHDPQQLVEEVAKLKQRSSELEISAEQYEKYVKALEKAKKLEEEVSTLTGKVKLQRESRGNASIDDIQPEQSKEVLQHEIDRLKLVVFEKDRRIATIQKQVEEANLAKEDLNRVQQHSKEQSKQVMELKRERMAFQVILCTDFEHHNSHTFPLICKPYYRLGD